MTRETYGTPSEIAHRLTLPGPCYVYVNGVSEYIKVNKSDLREQVLRAPLIGDTCGFVLVVHEDGSKFIETA